MLLKYTTFVYPILKYKCFQVLSLFKESFCELGFDTDAENFKTGNVSLLDAKKFIREITAPGAQVKTSNFTLLILIFNDFRLEGI